MTEPNFFIDEDGRVHEVIDNHFIRRPKQIKITFTDTSEELYFESMNLAGKFIQKKFGLKSNRQSYLSLILNGKKAQPTVYKVEYV